MKLTKVNTYQYELPVTRTLTTASSARTRQGVIIELMDDQGNVGFGECAPLPGFSRESVDYVSEQLNKIAFGILGSALPENLEELSGGFESWLGRYNATPSVRFACESAILSLIASHSKYSLSQLLSSESATLLPVNALLSGERDDVINSARKHLDAGFTAFKMKVGNQEIRDDIGLTGIVRDIIGDDCVLRLDANRQWDVRRAIDFWSAVDGLGIEYIEEPVADHAALVKELTKVGLPSLVSIMLPPTALDESIVDVNPETFDVPPGVKAIILKPTLLGLERAMRWARKAIHAGLTPVVTSSYETSIGITTLAHFGAALSSTPVPMGLATLDVFERDLLNPAVRIENGAIDITKLPDIKTTIQRDTLTLVSSHG